MNPLAGVIAGAHAVPAAFRLLRAPGIAPYVRIPLLVNVVVFVLALTALGEGYAQWLAEVGAHWPDWLRWLAWLAFGTLGLVLVFFGFSLLANVFASPFNGLLSAAVERHGGAAGPALGGWSALPGEALRSLVAELRKTLYIAVRAVPLLVLTVLPGVNVVAMPLWILFGAWMLALQYLDCPFANHGQPFPRVLTAVRGGRGVALGFGLAMLLLTLIPGLNFVAVPVGVIAATRLYQAHFAPPLAP